MKSDKEMLQVIRANLEGAKGEEADALIMELKEWQIWASMAGGAIPGFFVPLMAIDAIDGAVDGTTWDPNIKAAVKWTERGIDLALGIIGTAVNGYKISRGGAKWHHYLLSGLSLQQIPVAVYKSLELAGVIGGAGAGRSALKKPIANLRAELEAKLKGIEARLDTSTVQEEQKFPEIQYPAGA